MSLHGLLKYKQNAIREMQPLFLQPFGNEIFLCQSSVSTDKSIYQ